MHTLPKQTYALAICLSALAGCVDAIGFLQLGGHFISFMSGNSTQLAVGLASGNQDVVWLLGSIISLFVVGCMVGVWARHFAAGRFAATAVLMLVTLLLFCAAVSNEKGWAYAAIACMTLAMGAENAIFHRNGEVVVGLTYMTGTLVKVGQRLAHATLGGPAFSWFPYMLLWLGLISGGAAGAVLFHYFGFHGLWGAAAWAAVLALVSARKPLLD